MMRFSLVRFGRANRLFILTVILPTLLAIVYFGFIASDVYVSESRFVVRNPEKPAMSGMGLLLKAGGFSSGGDEVYAVQKYVISRDALRALDRNGEFRKAYTRDDISLFDRFNAFAGNNSFEQLYKYYENKVVVDHDSTSSITTLTVRAFSARDAQRFNERLLEMAEGTVNRLNDRARKDVIRASTQELDEAKQRAQAAAVALSVFRNREGVVDPEKQANVQLQMVSKLQDELISARAQLAQLRSVAPENAQIPVLEASVRSLSRDIDVELGKVAGNRRSLSSSAVQYQRLQLESQFADRQIATTMAALQDAKNEALRQQAYVERIVEPNLPDDAIEPRRLRDILSTVLFSLIVWGVLTMLLGGIREHQQ